ncbi:MAG: DUF952 domain-containing protein [Polyangiales bacterium]
MSETVYKILPRTAWEAAIAAGVYHGSADDQRDGFIHLSRAHQLEGTLSKHFAGQSDLVLVSLSSDRLGAALRFEVSRGGEPFPHLYGPLDPALALEVRPVEPG